MVSLIRHEPLYRVIAMRWKRALFKLLKRNGYEVVEDNIMWKKKKFACEWYYDAEVVFGVERKSDGHRIIIIPVGDILVFNPKKPEEEYFEWKNCNQSGYLTEALMKNGHWERNNWFEVIELEREKGQWLQINDGDDNIAHWIVDAFNILKEYFKPQIWNVS